MTGITRAVFGAFLTVALTQGSPAFAADVESDALSLESAPSVTPTEGVQTTKIFVEGALGTATQRYGRGSRDLSRLSLDFSHNARLGPGLRAFISDRIDQIHPRDPAGADETVNSLREAYLSWQPEGGNSVVAFGRINLRYGPSYGFNPTDFFRDGSLRALTTADPFALRENRLGSVMLRAEHLWTGGSLSVALSPKLANRPSMDSWSLDLGSTNNRDRALVALGTRFSQSISSQLLIYKEDGLSSALGANVTALLSDAAVAHLEWSRSKEPDLLSRALALPATSEQRNRFVSGVTYTTLSKLSITGEYQYNGFGLNRANWDALGTSPSAQLAYLSEALRRQDLAPRQAYLIYVTQKNLWLKDLDLTTYIRFNPSDSSRLAWLELRRHWPSFDLTFQLQKNIGRAQTEFGVLPDRSVMQILGTYYF